MEEGTKNKKTVFVGGISEDTDETTLYEAFFMSGMVGYPSLVLLAAYWLYLH